MRVTTLIENSTLAGREDLTAEFGLSLHIRRGDLQILFDTGASGAFADNAKRLDIDLAKVNVAVLSHHHYDHGGGLRRPGDGWLDRSRSCSDSRTSVAERLILQRLRRWNPIPQHVRGSSVQRS